jgi:two-component system LytT family response regulator
VSVAVLVADDEPLARRALRELVAGVPWMRLLGEAADGEALRRGLDALRPQLAFLDVEMPGLDGIEALSRAGHKPAVVFTTAYDRYAVAAFELHAVDYLLKPFTRERFLAAADRAREAVARQDGAAAARAASAREPGPLRRLFVRDRGRILALALGEVDRLEAEDDYVAVHAGGRRFLVHLPLKEFERRLDAARFLRVHRRHVVNLDRVVALSPAEDSRLVVELRDGARVTASRDGSRRLRALAL